MIADTIPLNTPLQRVKDFFVMVNETLERQLEILPKACQLLYRDLRRKAPPNQVFEFDLKVHQEWTEESRQRPYKLDTNQRALRKLVNAGLVEIVRIVGRGYQAFKLKVLDPNTLPDSATLGKKSENSEKNPTKQPSNPHELVVSLIDKKETTTEPTTHPVVVGEQKIETADSPRKEVEGLDPTPKNASQEQLILGEEENSAAAAAQAVGVNLNPHVRKLLNQYDSEAILRAVKVVEQQKDKRNATGLFVRALKEGWQPHEEIPQPEDPHPLADKYFTAEDFPPIQYEEDEASRVERQQTARKAGQIVAALKEKKDQMQRNLAAWRTQISDYLDGVGELPQLLPSSPQLAHVVHGHALEEGSGRGMKRLADLIGSSQQEPPIPNKPAIAAPPSGLESIGIRLNPHPSSG